MSRSRMASRPNRHQILQRLLCGVALCCSSAGIAEAQTPDGSSVETVTVTGTQIRGAAPVGSSIISVNRDDLEASGATTTADFLKTQPQVFNFGITDTQRSGTGGAGNITYASAINLRGLSPYATLTLLDGHRSVPSGPLGSAVDPSTIPTVMLQRVDVVADGASATYGADAIAGVVNLIMRRNFDGQQVSARGGWGDGYYEQQFDILFGRSWGSGQITVGLEDSEHSALAGPSRGFYASNQSGSGGPDYRVSTCNPGTITSGGVTYAIPAAGVTPATASSLVGGTKNLCDPLKYNDLIPAQTRYTGAATFDQQITDGFKIFGDLYYARRDYTRTAALLAGPLTVTKANPYFVAPPGSAVTSETVGYFFGGQGIGNADLTHGYSVNEQVTLGADVNLWGDWLWETVASYGHDRDQSASVSINTALVNAAIASTNPATALNLFGANSTDILSSVNNQLIISPGWIYRDTVYSKVDGSLFSLPGGTVKGAFGAQFEHDSLRDGQISTVTTNPVRTGALQHQTRDDYALYGELFIPIIGDANAVPLVKSLNLDAGIRYSSYSVVGATTNPKFGLDWQVTDDFKLHSSYGTSFRAPLLSELVGPTNFVYVQTYATPTGTVQGLTLAGGNTTLKPETAVTWSVGGDWTPEFLTDAHASLNYFHISYKNGISSYLSNLNILQNPTKYAAIITNCPSAACTVLLNKYVLGIGPNADPRTIRGILPANPAVFVDGTSENLSTTLASGIDFQFSSKLANLAGGVLNFGLSGTYYTEFTQSVTPGAPVSSELNRIGFPLRMRFRGNLGWQSDPWTAALFLNYANSYINDLATPVQTVDTYATVDIHVGYDLGGLMSSDVLKDARLSLDVTNLLDAEPPYVNSVPSANGGGGFDPQNANAIGRIVAVSISKRF